MNKRNSHFLRDLEEDLNPVLQIWARCSLRGRETTLGHENRGESQLLDSGCGSAKERLQWENSNLAIMEPGVSPSQSLTVLCLARPSTSVPFVPSGTGLSYLSEKVAIGSKVILYVKYGASDVPSCR